MTQYKPHPQRMRLFYWPPARSPLFSDISEKTQIRATIPVSTKAARLLKKYDHDFSFTSNQQANRELKRIASMAGINKVVSQGKQSGPKSQFVIFHTARRSAATNLRLQGASLKTIADLGGWKKLSTLEVYLRASGMDSAILAKKLDFSNDPTV